MAVFHADKNYFYGEVMLKNFMAAAVLLVFVLSASAQETPVSNELELSAAISGSGDILITTADFALTGAVGIPTGANLYIHAASTPTYFKGESSVKIFDIQNSNVSFKDIGFKDMQGNIFINADNSILSFENAAFENNDSGNADSGFVFIDGSDIGFSGQTNFTSNIGQSGGGFYAESSNVSFSADVKFTDNKSLFSSGGAVRASVASSSGLVSGSFLTSFSGSGK